MTDDYIEIVKDLAKSNVVDADWGCLLCGEEGLNDANHDETCPWLRARKIVEESKQPDITDCKVGDIFDGQVMITGKECLPNGMVSISYVPIHKPTWESSPSIKDGEIVQTPDGPVRMRTREGLQGDKK